MESIPFAPAPITEPASLRELYLKRLRRLQRLRGQHGRELNSLGLRLLDRSLFAAYCDCRDVGAEVEARDILSGAHCDIERPVDGGADGSDLLPDAASCPEC